MSDPIFGIPIDFILFGLTLLGVAVFHHSTLAVALIVAVRREDIRAMPCAAFLLTLAIVSNHFTAMGAVEIVPDSTRVMSASSLASEASVEEIVPNSSARFCSYS